MEEVELNVLEAANENPQLKATIEDLSVASGANIIDEEISLQKVDQQPPKVLIPIKMKKKGEEPLPNPIYPHTLI